MRVIATVVGAVVSVALLAWPAPASACGGFFCSTVPIDQSGEEIVFDIHDGKVDAHIGIQYQGEAKDFSWVVPVHGVPTLKIAAPQFFQYLRQSTQPTFQLQYEQGSCGWLYPPMYAEAGGAADAGASEDGSVHVLSQGQVGPYDSAVVAANDRDALAKWLSDNGYTLQDPGVLEPYVGQGYNFLALKLQQNASVGQLRPIVVEFGGDVPCIPIRLTAVAARPDMPITAYVFASHRAVPINYRHVLINETRIDWVNFGSNYTQVASRAVDEAGGQAFLTEFAGAVQPLASPSPYQLAGPDLDTSLLASKTDPVDFTLALFAQNFPRGDPAIFVMFQKYIPEPAVLKGSVTEQQFYNQIQQYRSEIENDPGRAPFDAAGFANELQTTIVEPLLDARAVLQRQPYLTRLFTTMSAEEMTVDPEFDFNADAPDVSNQHTAKGKVECNSDGSARKVEITLNDGRRYDVDFGSGAFSQGPYAERIEQYTNTGAPAVIADKSKEIDKLIVKAGGVAAGADGCGGCGAAGFSPLLGGLFALSLGAFRRRSRSP